ncbi:uncharacterized protein LOC126574085 [Anopheles aquasalis]|uniref:uncharacterized protein LOC126574085 n=1 Tax=Anopheles aquasalis TaxID=42839 RepID=UPI00215AE0B8|nr:uncharacterized protein LOC126574085 [Anopheles aquasalis]
MSEHDRFEALMAMLTSLKKDLGSMAAKVSYLEKELDECKKDNAVLQLRIDTLVAAQRTAPVRQERENPAQQGPECQQRPERTAMVAPHTFAELIKEPGEGEGWNTVGKQGRVVRASRAAATQPREVTAPARRLLPTGRTDVLKIQLPEGQAFLDVCRKLQEESAMGVKMMAPRQSRQGDVLLKMPRLADSEQVAGAVRQCLGKDTKTTVVQQLLEVAVHNIDPVAEADDVKAAIVNALGPSGRANLVTVAMRRMQDQQQRARIISVLFPHHDPMEWPARTLSHNAQSLREVTDSELLDIAARLATKKAPGPDGIPNVAVATSMAKYPAVYRQLFQELLNNCEFPTEWKVQRLVLLPKPGKQPGSASSYRPLCLLNTVGKVFERVLLSRLNDYVEHATDGARLSTRQFGFRKGRSTISAIEAVLDHAKHALSFGVSNGRNKRCCAVVALDVRNAFNSASWTRIGQALNRMAVPEPLLRIIGQYFRGRILQYQTSQGILSRAVTAGVPQGSILGPTLWNILYDSVLAVQLPPDCSIYAYADDVIITALATTPALAIELATEAVDAVRGWMIAHDLKLTTEKTETLVFTSMRKDRVTAYEMDGQALSVSRSIRYLGVMLQERLQWGPHVQFIAEKAMKQVQALRFAMRNHGGPSSQSRKIIASVIDSTLCYVAPIWAEQATNLQCNRRILQRVQREMAKGVASTFRTASYWSAVLLARLVPICLRLNEDARCYRATREHQACALTIRKRERAATFQAWQQEWDKEKDDRTASLHSRWIRRVIPDVERWFSRNHGQVNFHLSQILSGHGFFREYLHGRGFTRSPDCTNCHGVPETPEHVLFECPRFSAVRDQCLTEGGTILTPEALLEHMLQGTHEWDNVSRAARDITSQLQREWAEEQARVARLEAAAAPALAAAIIETRRLRYNAAQRRRRAERRQLSSSSEAGQRVALQRQQRNARARDRRAARTIEADPTKRQVVEARLRLRRAQDELRAALTSGNLEEVERCRRAVDEEAAILAVERRFRRRLLQQQPREAIGRPVPVANAA